MTALAVIATAGLSWMGVPDPRLKMIYQRPPTPSPLTEDERRYRNDLKWMRIDERRSRRGRRGVSRRIKYRLKTLAYAGVL